MTAKRCIRVETEQGGYVTTLELDGAIVPQIGSKVSIRKEDSNEVYRVKDIVFTHVDWGIGAVLQEITLIVEPV